MYIAGPCYYIKKSKGVKWMKGKWGGGIDRNVTCSYMHRMCDQIKETRATCTCKLTIGTVGKMSWLNTQWL